MERFHERLGKLGTVRLGEYAGLRLSVERDPSLTGWHVFIFDDGTNCLPGRLPALDLWAETEEDAQEWLDDYDVEWSDETADPVIST